ncbi:MAG: sigma 54-interacting transcriptional regulator [Pseudomonadota bacterium]
MTHPDPRLWHLICDSIAEAVFTVDADFRILSFNTAAERMTGLPRERAIGRYCRDVFRTDLCPTRCALKRTLETGIPVRDARVRIRHQDRRLIPVAVSTTVLRGEHGEVLGGVEIMRDLSDVARLERRLGDQRVFEDMVGVCPAMQRIFRLLPDVARADVAVLIQGPSGTGKELVARAIHRLSGRCDGPFVQVNCGALPDTLLESELFGFRKGAFTGALRDSPGRFVSASSGTLLLDEIGDTSPAFQVKLLRAIQEGEVHALGADRPTRVDVRVISATNRDLGALVQQGRFREDLFYRLRVIGLDLPSLAERREDIALLVTHLLRKVGQKQGREGLLLSQAAVELLLTYDYPGNVRELENILQRAVALCHGDTIEPEHLPPELLTAGRRPAPCRDPRPAVPRAPPAPVSQEGHILLEALTAHGWNRERTARALGIGRTTLWRRMREHGLLG